MSVRTSFCLAGAIALSVHAPARAQAPEAEAHLSAQTPTPGSPAAEAARPSAAKDMTELSKQTQNPLANLVSVPLQFNFNTGGAYHARTGFNLNIQPVLPVHIKHGWLAIVRPVIPIQTVPVDAGKRERGIGDIQLQTYIAPKPFGGLTLGLGPAFSFPTATNAALETGTWAIGPAAIIVQNLGPFVIGGLVNQFWPVADHGAAPKLNLLVLQPFINFNFDAGWALIFAPIMNANWRADRGDRWTLPLGGGVARTFVFRKQPMTLSAHYYQNVLRPPGSPGGQLRFVLSLLFPG